MPEIRELSKGMINKIAAGEVVERPANVVKELVENSIDAGATRIEILVERSGSELIKIVDDGCGIAAEQLVLALSPHSTSKISEAEDLFRIHTLGFRGEALASIAEVSQLVLSSRTAENPEGAQIRSDGGVFNDVVPCGRPVGTTIEARNLFFNVPARRKFLKSPTTEFGHISEAVVRVSLPRPGVHFVLKHNERTVYDLPAADGMKERIGRVFGNDVASRLVQIDSSYKNVKVGGFVGLPDLSRGSQNLQYLFLNGRYVRDRALQHALGEAYRGLLVSGRYPVAFLNIETPPDFVDVNVHPSKLEVRFVDGQAIYAGVLSAIRDRFLRSDLTSRPNDAELDAAARRSQVENSSAESQRSNEFAPQRTDEKSTRTDEKPTPERRFVPDVDSSDPIAALDANIAKSRRDNILGWLNSGKNASNSPSADEKTDEKPPLDFDAANAALDEAALDASNAPEISPTSRATSTSTSTSNSPQKIERSQPFERSQPSAGASRIGGGQILGGNSEFRKFPTLPESPFKPGTFGGKYDFDSKPANLDVPLKREETNEKSSSETPSPEKSSEKSSKTPIFAESDDEVNVKTSANSPISNSNRIAFASTGKPVVQICNRYLAMEVADGLALVDQHALHERLLFEKLKTNLSNGKLDSQRLLVPEVVDLAPTELPLALENRELFANLGLLIDGFGGSSVVINGYPAILRKAAPTEIFLAALETLQENRGKLERADLLDASLKQMACKAAIKAGDALRPDAISELVAAAEEELNSHHCPHGRPSTLVFSCQEIDKLFKRQ